MSNVDELIKQLLSDERSVEDLGDEEVQEVRRRMNPLGRAIKLENPTNKFYAYSLINLHEEYLKKFLMTSLIGFLYRRGDEWGVPDGDYVMPIEEMDIQQIKKDYIAENVIDGKVVLRQERKVGVSGGEGFSQEETKYNKFKRAIIREFLDELFVYNPDLHVRSAYQSNKEDPERKVIGKSKSKKTPVPETSQPKLTKHQEYLRTTSHIPPADLFHLFNYYINSNVDALRIATRDLYCEKPDLDHLLIIYKDFDTMEQYNDFVHKHEDDVTADIRCATQNQWTFQAMFGRNVDRRQFYNKNTRILQEMLDHVEAGQKLGRDMMQKRIKRKKDQNIEECGPDDEKFLKDYKASMNSKMKKAGIRNINSDKERAIVDLERKYYNKYDKPDEDAEDGIIVRTWTHDPKNKRMETSTFLTESESVDPHKTRLTANTESEK